MDINTFFEMQENFQKLQFNYNTEPGTQQHDELNKEFYNLLSKYVSTGDGDLTKLENPDRKLTPFVTTNVGTTSPSAPRFFNAQTSSISTEEFLIAQESSPNYQIDRKDKIDMIMKREQFNVTLDFAL
jgi:hypothetical protein